MRIIRATPATGKPPKIICRPSKSLVISRVAVADDAVGNIVGPDVVIGPDGPVRVGAIIDEDEMQPLCEECVTALERAEEAARTVARCRGSVP